MYLTEKRLSFPPGRVTGQNVSLYVSIFYALVHGSISEVMLILEQVRLACFHLATRRNRKGAKTGAFFQLGGIACLLTTGRDLHRDFGSLYRHLCESSS